MGKKNSKRFLIITSFTIPETAGSGIHAFRYADYLNRNGYPARILSFNRNMRYNTIEDNNGSKIVRIPYFNANLLTKLLSLPFILLFYSWHIIFSDVVFIYGSRIIGYEYAIIFGKIFGKKVVFQSLLIGIDDAGKLVKKNKIFPWLYRQLLAGIDVYHAINPFFSRQYKKEIHKPQKIFESPQGVNTELFNPVEGRERLNIRKKTGLRFDGFIIVSIGFFINRKRYHEIFEVLSNINIPFQYLVLGEYDFKKGHFLFPYAKKAQEIVETGKNMLGNRLIIKGNVIDPLPYLQCADLFLINSHQEGLPNVLLEAMACGIPVACSNIKGLQNTIIKNNQNALAFEDTKSMRSVIEYIFYHPDEAKQLGKNARKFAEDFCSYEVVQAKLMKKLYYMKG